MWEGRCYQVQIGSLQTLLIHAYLELPCWKWLTGLGLILFQEELTHHLTFTSCKFPETGDVTFTGCKHTGMTEGGPQGTHYQQIHLKCKVVWKENSKSLLAPWPQPSKALPSVLRTCLSMLFISRLEDLLGFLPCEHSRGKKAAKLPLSGHSWQAATINRGQQC